MCEQGRVGRGEGCMGAIGGSGGDQAGQVVRDRGPLSELLGWGEGGQRVIPSRLCTPSRQCLVLPAPSQPLLLASSMEETNDYAYRNHRIIQSRTTGRRTRKTEPDGINAKSLNLSSSSRTPILRRLPSSQSRQPKKEEDRPTPHYVCPTMGRQPREEEDRPKAHCLSTQKVLAQDEEDRPQATAYIIQARWQLSGVQDTSGTAPARN